MGSNHQVLPLRARVDGGEMEMKGTPYSPKLQSYHHCLMLYPEHSLVGSYPSAEKQSVYFTAPADWTGASGVRTY